MKKDGLLCWNCRKEVPYSIDIRKRVRNIDGKQYDYYEKFGTCDICHEEIMVPGLIDENESIVDSIIRADKNLITVDEIKDILKKYNIEKRPLSHVLGLGEHTVSRYIEGALPNKKYSDLLRKVYKDHKVMRELLERNRNSITEAAYRKTDSAIAEMEKMCSYNSKAELIALYIIHKAYEVTDLFLQKMLYYVKAFSWVRLRKDIIEDDCEAWAYGPVFPEIYEKYKSFGSDVIDDYDESIEYGSLLTDEEIKIIDFVVECFGIYNGSTLMKITHKEQPWIEARIGIPEFAFSSNRIDNRRIYEYFDQMNERYDLMSIDGVRAYIRDFGVI